MRRGTRADRRAPAGGIGQSTRLRAAAHRRGQDRRHRGRAAARGRRRRSAPVGRVASIDPGCSLPACRGTRSTTAYPTRQRSQLLPAWPHKVAARPRIVCAIACHADCPLWTVVSSNSGCRGPRMTRMTQPRPRPSGARLPMHADHASCSRVSDALRTSSVLRSGLPWAATSAVGCGRSVHEQARESL